MRTAKTLIRLVDGRRRCYFVGFVILQLIKVNDNNKKDTLSMLIDLAYVNDNNMETTLSIVN